MKSENIEKMVMAQLSPNLSSSNPKNSKKQAYCPFIFKGNREYPFNSKIKDNLNYPSPGTSCLRIGSYEMKSSFTTQENESLLLLKRNGLYHRNTETTIFKSKIKRFQSKEKQGPAPNAYMNMSDFEKEEDSRKKKKKMATMIKNMNKILCQDRKKSTKPSIPSKREKKDSICLESSRQKSNQNPMKNKILQQKKIKNHINEMRSYNFGIFNKTKEIDRLKQTTTMFMPKQSNQEEKEETKSLQIPQRSQVKIRNTKKVYYNKQKIETIQKQNKKHQEIGPGWYQTKSSFRKEKGKGSFEFFQSSTVRFYEENSNIDERNLFYEDPYKKYKLVTNKKSLKIGRPGKKIKGETKQNIFNMRFSIESGRSKEKMKYADRQTRKLKNEVHLKDNRQIKTSINKFSDYYKKKQENTKSNIRIRMNSNKKYHRIT